jgi:polygalacturonase
MKTIQDVAKYTLLIFFLLVITSVLRLSSLVAQVVPLSYTAGLPFTMPAIQVAAFPSHTVNIVEFGAVADGQTMNTKAFADAIQACKQAGGGTIVVPAGVWLTGPIKFESNINLHVERGALVLFSKKRDDFPMMPFPTPTSNNLLCTPPVFGYKLENVAITGDGVLDGSGEVWRPMKKEKYTANQWKKTINSGGAVSEDGKMWWPSKQALQAEATIKAFGKDKKNPTKEELESLRDFLRPNMIVFYGCKKVLLDGPTFQNSPKFNVNPVQCEDVVIRNVKVLNPWNAQNGDGIDIGSCHNVIVYNSMVDVGDDAICLKPGTIEKGKDWTAACENIIIADCIVYHGHGGFVIGSETYGGTRNVSVRNCTFIGTDVGLRFKSSRNRGGLTENVYVDGIQMKDIPNEAMLFDMYYEDDKPESGQARTSVPVTERTPRMQKIFIKNVVCSGADRAIFVQGLPEQFAKDIEFSNITISAKNGISCVDAEGLQFKNVKILLDQGPVFNIDNARNISVAQLSYSQGVDLFMKVEGKESSGIQLLNMDISKAKKGIELGKDVQANAVIQHR